MMGTSIVDTHHPILKCNNAILAFTDDVVLVVTQLFGFEVEHCFDKSSEAHLISPENSGKITAGLKLLPVTTAGWISPTGTSSVSGTDTLVKWGFVLLLKCFYY